MVSLYAWRCCTCSLGDLGCEGPLAHNSVLALVRVRAREGGGHENLDPWRTRHRPLHTSRWHGGYPHRCRQNRRHRPGCHRDGLATRGIDALDAPLEVIEAHGLLVVPGLIDIHTHLREPGYEYKESIETGSAAAVAGGFTSIACMANTNPVNDDAAVTEYILDKARAVGLVQVFPIGAVSVGLAGERLAEIGELKQAGVVGISDDGKSVMNSHLMRRALEYAGMFGLPVISHCEDTHLAAHGVMHEGRVSTELGLRGIPAQAEDIMVARDIALAELTGGRLHIAHVSTAGAVRLVHDAKARGLRVTAEVTPHHLFLTDEAVRGYDPNTKMYPPLRTAADVEALRQALRDGTIDAIATDHAPHDLADKEVEFDQAPVGIIGLETSLPLTLRLVNEGYSPSPRPSPNSPGGRLRSSGWPKGRCRWGLMPM